MRTQVFRRTFMVGAILFNVTFGSVTLVAKEPYQLPSSNSGSLAEKKSAILEELSKAVSDIAANASKALVYISVSKTVTVPQGYMDPFDLFGYGQPMQPPKQEGLGSGFIIDLDKGYIITNNHVIEDAEVISVKLANGETYDGKVIGRDPNTDVAVVQIAKETFKRTGVGALLLADSDSVTVGSFVVALGAPFGLEASVTLGIVSAIGRGPMQLTQLGNFLQTDAVVNPGNSGGPLVRLSDGRVIGMNTAIFSRSGGNQGIAFAVPTNLVREIALSIINEGRVTRGYIGVRFRPLEKDWVGSLNLPKDTTGTVVVEVESDGPAEKAGIKANDVIVEINTVAIRSHEELVNKIGLMKPGTKAELGLYREGKKRSVSITIGDWPGSKEIVAETEKKGKDKSAVNSLGLELSSIKYEGKWALKITKVASNSPAGRAGLQNGDVILGINGYSNNKELMDKFRAGEIKDTILLLVERSMEDPRSRRKLRERFLVSIRATD